MTERTDTGFVAVELALAVTLLLIPVALVCLTLPTWAERSALADDTAAQAARAAALTSSWPDATRAADQQAVVAARNAGLPDDAIDIQLTGNLTRGGTVTATARITIPAVAIPGIGGFADWARTVSHSERIDDYRSLP